MAKSYFRKWFPVSPKQYGYIEELLTGFDEDTKNLFKHVLVSTIIQFREFGGYVPVSGEFIKKHFRKGNWELLVKAGYIKESPPHQDSGKSRQFIIFHTKDTSSNVILENFKALGSTDAPSLDGVPPQRINLFTGHPINSSSKSKTRDDSKNEYPELIVKAIKSFTNCYINLPKVEAHLERLRSEYSALEREDPLYWSKYARWMNDHNCFLAVLEQGLTKTDHPDICTFPVAYEPQQNGRISFIRGGLQSCTREMKAAAYSGIDDLHNYDMASSQANILREQLELAEIECPWLIEYLGKDKKDYADRVGFSVDTWKDCTYAIIMGAYLPTNCSDKTLGIVKYITEAFPEKEDQQPALMRFRNEIEPLWDAICLWHEYLVTEIIPKTKYQAHKGEWYIQNAVEMTKKVESLRLGDKKNRPGKAKLAAFYLQGLEAKYIHHLTILGTKYGFTLIANEHDGLVTIGAIPEEAKEEARILSGLKFCTLVEKPFKKPLPV